jgi:hypothetical protein
MRIVASFHIALAIASTLVLGVACSSPQSPEGPSSEGSASPTPRGVATLSVVTFAQDGTWSLAVQSSGDGGPKAGGLTVEAACNAPLEAFFDQPVGAASTNELCFSGTGTIALATIPKPGGGTWAGAIESYVTQANAGYVSMDATGYDFCAPFAEALVQTNLVGASAKLGYLTIGPAACPVPSPPLCTSAEWLCKAECPSGLEERCIAKAGCPATPPGVTVQNWCCAHELRCVD